MKFLVTGGAGFIVRWVVKALINLNHQVWVVDNLSNSSKGNISEFEDKISFINGDVRRPDGLEGLFKNRFDCCIHLASRINVQESIDNPGNTVQNDILGAFHILEHARNTNTKVVFTSSALVYGAAVNGSITENHPIRPSCPYTASKIAVENLVLSYFHSYGLPNVVLRPFNTYGPFQKSNTEGGVVSIFITKYLKGEFLDVFGDGSQRRDLLYVEDCADFIIRCATSDNAKGEIINAGYGRDISINELALMISGDSGRIRHVAHPHPNAEVARLVCDYSKAKKLLGWQPRFDIADGIMKTRRWLENL